MMDKRIGAQLFTLRDYCKTAEELDTTFAKLQQIGYQIVQVSAVGPIPAEIIKETADKYGLKIVCTHKGFQDYTDHLEQLIADHHAMDCKIAGIGAMPREAWGNFEEVKKFVKTMNPIAAELKKSGLQFAYHHHALEFAKVNGKFMMDYLLEETDPENFKFIVDTYWLAVAGINPAEFIRKLGKRAVCVHFKDLEIVENNAVMAEVMEGNLDWDAIIAACEDVGTQWALVEQDICRRDPFESMEISYNNLKTKGFC